MSSFKRKKVKLPAIDSKSKFGRRPRKTKTFINSGFDFKKDVKPWDSEIELMPITDQEEGFEFNNLSL